MFARLFATLAVALSMFAAMPAHASAPPTAMTPEQAAQIEAMQALMDSLHPRTGTVAVPQADLTLNLGEAYYMLDAAEAKRVLTEGWGNPDDSVSDVIGMIFPAGKTFVDDTWGAVLTWTPDGYVSDEDAHKINYGDLLNQMREGEDEGNRARQQAGFAGVHLVGWAQQPSYDATRHTLIWAKELSFSDAPNGPNTLNYDVRVLGRRGVFSMNMVTSMDRLAETRTAATALMGTAAFNAGARYTDYQAGTDKKAAYGVAGLIAGGAVLAVAKKAGLLGILLIVLKKGGVFLLAGAGAVFAWLRNLFSGKKGGEFAGERPAYYPGVDAEPDPSLAPIPQEPATEPTTEADPTPPTETDKPL
jgi:uncharacterized membrane-anchored protein